MGDLIALQKGTELAGDYRIERVLGAGGFGITYLAREVALDRPVTIKEYFPVDFAARKSDGVAVPRSRGSREDYTWGLDRFIEEAQILAKFDHPNIVRVYRYFRANQTAYMALQFEQGQPLKSWLTSLGRAPRQTELDAILAPLLDALDTIHEQDFLHRDIAPDNIIIREDRSPVLIDFGSARGALAGHSKTVSALVKPGYSPYEQYAETSSGQGPWTDIYALASTLYLAVTGKRPPDSPSRVLKDTYVSAVDAATGAYRRRFLEAIDRALSRRIEDRPQSIRAWRGELLGPDRPVLPIRDKKAEKSWWSGGGGKADNVEDEAAAGGVTPPRPDAPGRPGGLLDYFDRVSRTSGHAQAPDVGIRDSKVAKASAPAQEPAPQPAKPQPSAPNNAKVDPAGTAKLTTPPVFRFKGADRAEPAKSAVGADKKQKNKKAANDQKRKAAAAAKSPKPAARQKPRRDKQPAAKPWRQRALVVRKPARKPARIPLSAGATALLTARSAHLSRARSIVSLAAKLGVGVLVAQFAVSYQKTLEKADSERQLAAVPPPISNPQQPRGNAFATSAITTSSLRRNEQLSAKLESLGPSTPTVQTRAPAVQSAALDTRPAPAVTLDRNPLLQTIAAHDGPINAVAVSQDQRFAVSAGSDGTIRVFDLASGTHARTIRLDHGPAKTIAIQKNRLATGHRGGFISIWNLETGGKIAALRRNQADIWELAFTTTEGHLAAAGHDWKVALWDLANKDKPLHVFDAHENAVMSLALSGDGSVLATGSADKTVRLWNLDTFDPIRTYRRQRGLVSALAMSADGDEIAAATLNGEFVAGSSRSRRLSRRMRGHDGRVNALAFAPRGSLLASASTDGTVRLWDVRRRETIRTLVGHDGAVADVAFDATGDRLITGGKDGTIRIWSIAAARD